MPACPSPPGQVQNTKESQIQHGVGVGESINCDWQGQAPAQSLTLAPRILNDTDHTNLPSLSLLTKIKSHVPNKPRVRRQLEDQGQSERRQVDMAREKQAEKRHSGRQSGTVRTPEGPRQEERRSDRDSQRHTGSKFPEAVSNSTARL